jgi:type IV pilus assembly protein PilZ
MSDKRAHLRTEVRIPVACEGEGLPPFNAMLTDISLGGSRCECGNPPPYGSSVTIVGMLPGSTHLSRLPAVVRWVDPHSFGIQFGLLGARDTRLIAEAMAQTVRSRRFGQ